jgi:signal transduction histidine kinase
VLEVVNEEGRIVAREPPLFLLREVPDAAGLAAMVRRGAGTGELEFPDGVRRLAGVAPIRSTGWIAVAGVPAGAVGAETRRRVALTVGAGMALAVLVVAGASLAGRRQARGMERLRAGMRRVASGDLPPALPVTVGGEVGALTEAFNRMLAWLHNRVREYEVLSQVADEAGAAVTANASAEGILPGLLRKVVNGMGADAGVVQVREGTELVARAAVGLPGARPDTVRLRRGQGLGWGVLGERATVVVADVDADYRVEEPYLRDSGLRVIVGTPIQVGDEPHGALLVGYRRPQPVGEAEVQRLEVLARRTAQAIEHARAFDAVRQSTAGLEAQVAEQIEALERAAHEQAETRQLAQEEGRKAREAARKAQELEQAMRAQAERPPEIREVIVEKEVIREREVLRHDGGGADGARLRAEMQKTVSEELRAPLSALLDLPRFLVEGLHQPLAQEERTQLEVLRDRGEEILELIDGLVVLTGLEAGQVKVVRAAFDLPGLVQRVIRVLQPRAAAKGNRIEADIKLHVGQVTSDARRVEEILSGLLVNAIRYTEVGEIKVTCYLRDTDVVIVVADDGAGFAPEEVDRVFQPFLQVGPRDGRRLPGTGLTLVVCERLVRALGGRLKVESEVDRGSWFTVTLPGAAG